MKNIQIKCCKISPKIPLDKIGNYFGFNKISSWKTYICLDKDNVSQIIKELVSDTKVYIFQYGILGFVNLNEVQIQMIVNFMESFIGKIDYNQFSLQREKHEFVLSNENSCFVYEGSEKEIEFDWDIVEGTAVVLSKSIELERYENILNSVLDSVENYISEISQNRINLKRGIFRRNMAKVLRFQTDSLYSIKVFDRDFYDYDSVRGKFIFKELCKHFEIFERFDVLEEKINNLNSVMKTYRERAFMSEERRIFWYEILLIGMFPLTGIVRRFFE